MPKIVLPFLVAGILVLMGVGIFAASKFLPPKTPQQVGCTMEAKICPDGSAVGRSGPNCEFAKCPDVPANSAFGSPINFKVGKQVIFDDGLTVTLKEINDSRCKPGVVCIWAGELSSVFDVVGATPGANTPFTQEIILGTTNNKKVAKHGYVFELKDATEISATIIVTKYGVRMVCTDEAKLCSDGTYVGRIGPNCEFAACPSTSGSCYVGGCSGQICSDTPDTTGMTANCVYNSQYACYETATCARQSNGQCGWTQTTALVSCINNSN